MKASEIDSARGVESKKPSNFNASPAFAQPPLQLISGALPRLRNLIFKQDTVDQRQQSLLRRKIVQGRDQIGVMEVSNPKSLRL